MDQPQGAREVVRLENELVLGVQPLASLVDHAGNVALYAEKLGVVQRLAVDPPHLLDLSGTLLGRRVEREWRDHKRLTPAAAGTAQRAAKDLLHGQHLKGVHQLALRTRCTSPLPSSRFRYLSSKRAISTWEAPRCSAASRISS